LGESPTEQERRYAALAESFLGRPGITRGTTGKKGFGSSALCVRDKIFAMLSSKGQFVVKLPRKRVDALVASGEGGRFDPGHGRMMKEWFVVEATSEDLWLSLANEALEFVGSGPA
jgi:hypothetical protein